ncbi:MAG: glutamine-hydrolyzing GMP synthase [Ignavibacteria bacterium]|nr:glutamine-hydrolyzing GMP synthase [Ignavibacteria bacterium]
MKKDFILILDFGSQYTQLIARRIREISVYSEIHPFNIDIKRFIEKRADVNLKGVILSGGPSSVFEKDSPLISESDIRFLIEKEIPVLGVCYGLHLLVHLLGGKIEKSRVHEYGHTVINLKKKNILFEKTNKNFKVWMSHGDAIKKLPENFKVTSLSNNGIISSFEDRKNNIYGLQFHPEVNHTEFGKEILNNFIFEVCNVKHLFKASSFIKEKITEIKEKAGKNLVLLALSGGVDSSVAAILTHKAIGKQLICMHIDTGLMRKNESRNVIRLFRQNFKLNVRHINDSELFLKRLKGVEDPEKKRKIIGNTFIEVFEKEAKKISKTRGKIKYLVQGTLYPDVIESISFRGPSVTIKSHHNVGGLPEKMKLKLIEPFKELFKDEVRNVGKSLGLPSYFIDRHPFPGPGLAIRILGAVSSEKLEILREADDVYINALKENNLYNKIWQAFSVLLPVKTVGVMGDRRSYDYLLALRAVTSTDGMTADFFQFDKEFLTFISNKIVNSVKGVNRVVYDISSKPPATIEWE